MDLIMELEGESETAGGEVIVIMGDHELMNIMGAGYASRKGRN